MQAGCLPHSILRCSYFLSIPLTSAFLHRISLVFSALYSPRAPAWGTSSRELPESRAWCVLPLQTVVRRHRLDPSRALALAVELHRPWSSRGTPSHLCWAGGEDGIHPSGFNVTCTSFPRHSENCPHAATVARMCLYYLTLPTFHALGIQFQARTVSFPQGSGTVTGIGCSAQGGAV